VTLLIVLVSPNPEIYYPGHISSLEAKDIMVNYPEDTYLLSKGVSLSESINSSLAQKLEIFTLKD
jgi:hypothetical protein